MISVKIGGVRLSSDDGSGAIGKWLMAVTKPHQVIVQPHQVSGN